MSKNPYVQKFSKAFNTGLFIVVFLVLAVVAACVPQQAYAAQLGDIPTVCLSSSEFQADYKNKEFEIVEFKDVTIFVEAKPTKAKKLTTESVNKGDTIRGTWLVDSEANFCLIILENADKFVKMQ